jgi:DNA polymerase III delta prime subunit
MKKIKLSGKYAVGRYTHALVDNEDFDYLNMWKWKAKPNADNNHVYAIRTSRQGQKTVDVRMHREIMKIKKDILLDVMHINRHGVDNQKANLRAVTRSENTKNREIRIKRYACTICGKILNHVTRTNVARKFCDNCLSVKNKDKLLKARTQEKAKKLRTATCLTCSEIFPTHLNNQKYCSYRCKHIMKQRRYRRRKKLGS